MKTKEYWGGTSWKRCRDARFCVSAYKSLRGIALLTAIIAFSCAVSATRLYAHPISPILTGFPDIGWDSNPGYPPNPTNGITTFTQGTGTLSITSSITSFLQGGVIPPSSLIGGTVSINASLIGTSIDGGFLHADFGTMGGAGWDITITDSAGGIALAGNLGDMTLDGLIGTPIGLSAAVFSPSTGYLLPDFPSGAGLVALTFNGAPFWSSTSFNTSWSAESKGDIGPIPEPTTIVLLGTGLLGMLGYSRRRFWRKKVELPHTKRLSVNLLNSLAKR